jgi:putative heme iron utilization protein
MNNKGLEKEISNEIISMIESRNSLMLSSLTEEGVPYASYAPYAIGDNCLYVLISEIAVHGKNLQLNPEASVLIIEDEDSAEELFARLRVVLKVNAQVMEIDSDGWNIGLNALVERHGDRISSLSQMSDFKLFKLNPMGGRYVKGFGKAYQIEGGSLGGTSLSHLREGHTKR